MWKIERLEFPFSKAKDNVIGCWETFVENFKVPYVFLSDRIRVILESAFLTSMEILDVETSWEEIQKGQAKKFTNVDEFLEELKS
jgi:hypothetical protein